MSTVVPGKGQKWPLRKRRAHHVETFLAQRRDEQEVAITCGIGGCGITFEGRFVDVRKKLEHHRKKNHPKWTAPTRRGR